MFCFNYWYYICIQKKLAYRVNINRGTVYDFKGIQLVCGDVVTCGDAVTRDDVVTCGVWCCVDRLVVCDVTLCVGGRNSIGFR